MSIPGGVTTSKGVCLQGGVSFTHTPKDVPWDRPPLWHRPHPPGTDHPSWTTPNVDRHDYQHTKTKKSLVIIMASKKVRIRCVSGASEGPNLCNQQIEYPVLTSMYVYLTLSHFLIKFSKIFLYKERLKKITQTTIITIQVTSQT